jgi:CRISPR system Cascade subunit CasC
MSDFVQLHFLTSYPPSNLNRDDLGRPKTAVFGGTQRLRVSSQSLKRAWRTSQKFTDIVEVPNGKRSRSIEKHLFNKMKEKKVSDEIARDVATKIAAEFRKAEKRVDDLDDKIRGYCVKAMKKEKIDKKKAKAIAEEIVTKFSESDETPAAAGTQDRDLGKLCVEVMERLGIANEAATKLATAIVEDQRKSESRASDEDEEPDDGPEKTQLIHFGIGELHRMNQLVERVAAGEVPSSEDYSKIREKPVDTVDIALFGRMLAGRSEEAVHAATQVAHAISVHRVTVEDDYFTAVDDLNTATGDTGAGHVDATEFAAAVFYQYVCINRTDLSKNLGDVSALVNKAIKALITACCTVAPTGKQNSFGSHARASYLLAEMGQQQPRSLSVAFLRAVEGPDILGSSIIALEKARSDMDAVYEKCADQCFSFRAYGDKSEGSLKSVLEGLGLENALEKASNA